MRTVLVAAAKSTAAIAARPPIGAVGRAADRAFDVLRPWQPEFTEFEWRWTSRGQRALVRMWSNEPEHPATQSGWRIDNDCVACWTGLFGSAVPPGLARASRRCGWPD